MDTVYYEIENVHRFFEILPEQETLDRVFGAMAVFDAHTLDIIGRELPPHISVELIKAARAEMLTQMIDIAKPLGYDPSVIIAPRPATGFAPQLPTRLSLALELADVGRELLQAWDRVQVLGIASKSGIGVPELLAVIPRFRAKLVELESIPTVRS